MTGRINSFESFGTVDGPGIRFVVFMQGCPMRCKFCHNPETWDYGKGYTEFTSEEVAKKVSSYRNYFSGGGGCTVSGGEPLMQPEFVAELFAYLSADGINTCLDTSGATFDEGSEVCVRKHDEVLKNCNLVLLDIKHIRDDKHFGLCGQSSKNPRAFARHLSDLGVPMWIRQVYVPGITWTCREEIEEERIFIKSLKTVKKVEVLPYHTMGKEKYEKLGIEYPLKDVRAATWGEVEPMRRYLCS
ncbi:MAG: pyruvate formate lyase-activating protein [Clostridia bacterium]|nr:pyruvate formate lyase-activating protein [Clostridia bacterium]